MQKLLPGVLLFAAVQLFFSCNNKSVPVNNEHDKANKLFANYFDERMQLYPLEATQNGDNRFNDQLPNDISFTYREKLKAFYQKYIDQLKDIDSSKLNTEDKMSYSILEWELNTDLEGFNFPDNLMPFNQFWGLPLTFAQLGSGQSNQPFKTVKDYDNFLGRVNGFTVWCDTAIANMKMGIEKGYVLPKILVQRMVPQLQALDSTTDIKNSVFYMPLKGFPADFSEADKSRLTSAYEKAIKEQIIPSYKKLDDFVKNEYLPKARTTTGIADIPGGKERYTYLAKYWTTTTMTPDQIFELGQSEVTRLHNEMEKVKDETGFKGDLKAFFTYVNTDKKFFPYSTPDEVLKGYWDIYHREEPQLKKMFNLVPKSKFEIRETEKFREASASAEYQQGTADGSRPGIFYVPIPNPAKSNTLSMEDLFLHEAIPGHHYQISIQQEDTSLPKFRRYLWYGAYGEGWALYCESLGKELGLYTDPYQYFGSLSEEMHRAIRLVVDVGMHVKGWTREQAIQFSLNNEAESEADITSEIERYMAIPGQALGYKIGQLKIIELRNDAQNMLGDKFVISGFHDQVLSSGCLPIALLESKIKAWTAAQKSQVRK